MHRIKAGSESTVSMRKPCLDLALEGNAQCTVENFLFDYHYYYQATIKGLTHKYCATVHHYLKSKYTMPEDFDGESSI